ncbi:hypothetical protein IW140_000046 [Coemansia sp. RSA 1813]|nr:hypothetical protein EV178_000152 [Coemansia sp. RSA 1646]KAJ1771379.1 hypothetical protein LPJ74_002419 [Coemansia sp. RSA 1843]KAJ2093152.1 hypothetical protein IW138_000444 [Coemansia sp. RSA 986]KAJ2217582.1 hypothetical protein EV179_000417 [Coemansia sp. RSA 487]KAJ2573405.1 hypothetical protein IW140_000046 [Coemansia sp. RSA 1813]
MSDYKPIDDESESHMKLKTENNTSSYSSHPYKTGYGGSTVRGGGGGGGGQAADSQVIDVGTSSSQADGEYGYGGEPTAGPSTFNSQDGGQRISRYETSLPIRHDVEAAIAYLLCIYSGVFLLIMEKKNDYVRFHAWQSTLMSMAFIVALIVTAFISNFLYWVTWIVALVASGYMARRAYIDGAVFERFALPYLGQWAVQFVDEE